MKHETQEEMTDAIKAKYTRQLRKFNSANVYIFFLNPRMFNVISYPQLHVIVIIVVREEEEKENN